MLQQTRAEAVIPYYERFLERFPDARSLAAAKEADVLASWSGLGYYSRARNLQAAARAIVAAGEFPSDYDSIHALAGVGPYTAAAVASIAFDLPHAVVDGNVMRVIARVRNDGADINSSATRARFRQIANELLDRRRPGQFNQAMMELGATVCLPRAPECGACPVARFCEARQASRERELPVKSAKAAAGRISIGVTIVENKGRILLRRRSSSLAVMPGFWELPAAGDLENSRLVETLGSFRHTITRHYYTVTVTRHEVSRAVRGYRWWPIARLGRIPLTTIARKALELLSARKVNRS